MTSPLPFMPKRLLVYVVASDVGLAPNITGNICSLAVCKPKIRQSANPDEDWLVGMSTNQHGPERLIYSCPVEEKLHYPDYWITPRFHVKKPNHNPPYGDNFNDIGWERGTYCTSRTGIHAGNPEKIARNHSAPYALIGHNFWYFGKNAPLLPHTFHETRLVQGARRGHKVISDPDIVTAFYSWITAEFPCGIYGPPRDI